MVLILTSDSDRTSRKVIDWLNCLGVNYIRFSSKCNLLIKKVTIGSEDSDIILNIDGHDINISSISTFWYRRDYFSPKYSVWEFLEDRLKNEINRQLKTEFNILSRYILDKLKLKSLNHPDDIYINKLTVLDEARNFGIQVPSSAIVSNKVDLINFYNNHNRRIITKNYSQGVFIRNEGKFKSALTLEVTEKMISKIDNEFYPLLIQEKIDKIFELRVFYLGHKFYSSAIFSQFDDRTKIDFRNYNYTNPNRVLSYNLSTDKEENYRNFLSKLQFDSCSLDIMVDHAGKHYFLEINPIGQFAQVSNPCNYNLEKRVALYLKNKSKS
jgi:ATP-GRASP peptide maturase of grasp-with-spasm system